MDEDLIKRLYKLYVYYQNSFLDDESSNITIVETIDFGRFNHFLKMNDISRINVQFIYILKQFFWRFGNKFDDDMKKILSQLLDSEDIANHQIAFELIYKQFKNI